jgi:hypothetical protein
MIYFTKLQIVSNEKIVKLVIFSFVGFFTDHNISQVDLISVSQLKVLLQGTLSISVQKKQLKRRQ